MLAAPSPFEALMFDTLGAVGVVCMDGVGVEEAIGW